MVIDVHSHLGWDCVFEEHFTREELLMKHRTLGISKSIVQPASCHDMETVRQQHDAVAQLCREFPGQFYGMANPNPHASELEYEKEIRRCIEELGFVGIKIHTAAHAVHPSGRDARKVYTLARELHVPVMIHTGAGIPFANPSLVLPAAEQFPDVKIVMAHCGMMVSAAETGIVMERCPNVYADITWTGGFLIRRWSEQFGAERFLFGSDHADNAGTELGKIRTCGLSEEQQETILYRAAQAVYGI